MRIEYMICKNKSIYAVYYKSIHTIYYNLDFIGETQLILLVNQN